MLNKNSSVPLVYQVEQLLCRQIIDREYHVGDVIPSQEKLAKIFEVSRITIKNAFSSLIDQGILEAYKGKGTFVKKVPEVNYFQNSIVIDRECLNSANYELLGVEINQIYSECQFLKSKKGHCITYRRIIDDYPLSVERIWWTDAINIRSVSIDDWAETHDTQQKLYNKLDLIVSHYEETIELRYADSIILDKMYLPIASPILCIKRKTYANKQSIPFEYRESLIRCEDYGKIIVTPNQTFN